MTAKRYLIVRINGSGTIVGKDYFVAESRRKALSLAQKQWPDSFVRCDGRVRNES